MGKMPVFVGRMQTRHCCCFRQKPSLSAGDINTVCQNTAYATPKTCVIDSGKKKSTKINFFGPETAGWGGGLPPEGVGVKKFVPSLESLSSLGFDARNLGCPGIFAGMSRTPGGVQKVCARKVCAHFAFPIDGQFMCGQASDSTGHLVLLIFSIVPFPAVGEGGGPLWSIPYPP